MKSVPEKSTGAGGGVTLVEVESLRRQPKFGRPFSQEVRFSRFHSLGCAKSHSQERMPKDRSCEARVLEGSSFVTEGAGLRGNHCLPSARQALPQPRGSMPHLYLHIRSIVRLLIEMRSMMPRQARH